jgi:hypothetical protein
MSMQCIKIVYYLTPFIPFRVNPSGRTPQGEPLSLKERGNWYGREAKPLFDSPLPSPPSQNREMYSLQESEENYDMNIFLSWLRPF